MSSQLVSSDGCCDQRCPPSTTIIPGPDGANGTNGAAGAPGTNAYTTTTAQFTVPSGVNTVVVSVASTAFIPVSPATAQFTIGIGNAGYFTLVSYTSNSITVKVKSAVAATTVIASGQIVTVAGTQGPAGAPGTSAANTATYVLNTADLDLVQAQVMATLGTGYAKIATGTGLFSTVTAIPVGDISGNWNLVNVTGALDVGNISGVLPLTKGGTGFNASTLASLRNYLGIAGYTNDFAYFSRYITINLSVNVSTTAADIFTDATTTSYLDNKSGWSASGFYVLPTNGIYEVNCVIGYDTLTGGVVSSLCIYQGASKISATPFSAATGVVSVTQLVVGAANDHISIKMVDLAGSPQTLNLLAASHFTIKRIN